MSDANVAEYLNLRIEEASARLRAVNRIVKHPTSQGDVGEEIIRGIVEAFLPKHYEVSSGFIATVRDEQLVQSKQIDVLVYNRSRFVPLYQNGGLVVVTPDMVTLAIEAKFVLNKTKLEESLANIQSAKELAPKLIGVVWGYQGMTVETLKKHLPELLNEMAASREQWPNRLFNLQRNYVVEQRETQSTSPFWTTFYGSAGHPL